MNKRCSVWAKTSGVILFSVLCVVLGAAALGMIIAAEKVYLNDSPFQAFAQTIYGLRGLVTATAIVSLVAAIALFVYLIIVAGRTPGKDGVTRCFADRVPLEIYFAIVFAACMTLFGASNVVLACVTSASTLVFLWLYALLYVCMAAIIMVSVMSIAVRIKTATLFTNTLIWMLISGCVKLIRSLWRQMLRIPTIWRGVMLLCVILLVNANVLIASVYSGAFGAMAWLLNLAILTLGIVFLLQFKQICRAGERLAAGDLEYQVDTRSMFFDLRRHGEDLNRVGSAAALAANERMKAERFRTELITNVSHDLKTPLTAMISYIDLMKREGLQSQNAPEYLRILEKQSQRLKKLTDDLVEASKAASGTLPVHVTPMPLGEFILQCVGEYQEYFQQAGLQVIVGDMQNLCVWADGRHIWRVFDNLLGNVRKYALSGTRVYIDAYEQDDMVSVRIRNISRNQLNISPDELMERFVRGDSSRGETEGSGLGLSIAMSLMKLQGGNFDIFINGDMFTARVQLKSCPQMQTCDLSQQEPETALQPV